MGNRRRLYSLLMQIAVGFLLVIIMYALYISYSSSGLSLQFTSILATFTLVVITAWYARSTARLLEKTEKQTEATRAAYAPKIDSSFTWKENTIELGISNRGTGVAKDIRVIVDVFTTEMGVESVGERYRYIAHFQQSLPPQKTLTNEKSNTITLSPCFFLDTADITVRNYVSNHGTEYHPALVESGMIEQDTLGHLVNYYENQGNGGSEHLPTETGDLFDLLERQLKSDNEPYALLVDVKVKYSDVIGRESYSEKIVDGHRVDADLSDYSEGIQPIYVPPLASGLHLKVYKYILSKSKEKLSPEFVTYPYEEDYSAVVSDI